VKKLRMAGEWATLPGFRWRLGRGVLWLSMGLTKVALHILPVPKGTTIVTTWNAPQEKENV
jgi:hypothetical protein